MEVVEIMLEKQTDTQFTWSDAWLLYAICHASGKAPARLRDVISTADYLNHAILTFSEVSGGLARLEREDLIVVDPGHWKLSCSEKALAYLRTLPQLQVQKCDAAIKHWLGVSSSAPDMSIPVSSTELYYPGLTPEIFTDVVAEYLRPASKS